MEVKHKKKILWISLILSVVFYLCVFRSESDETPVRLLSENTTREDTWEELSSVLSRFPSNENLSPGLEAWSQEQERRRVLVKNVCRKRGTPKNTSKKDRLLSLLPFKINLKNLLVSNEYKAIYCYIPKAGCSNWKRLWTVLSRRASTSDIHAIKNFDVHYIHGPKMMLLNEDNTTPKVLKKLKEYTKVIVVRDPLERLVSAYLDKIHHIKGTTPFQRQVLPFVQKQRPNATLTDIAWTEFVDFLIKPNGRYNEHWMSYDALCHPCEIDYDVIVNFDSLDEDSERFLSLIDAPRNLHFPEQAKKVTNDVKKIYLANLTSPQITGILKYFGKDFDMFGFDRLGTD